MKVAMIIAKDGFRDEEYLQPKEVLTKAKINVDTYSSSTGTAKGMLGATVKVEKTIDELKAEDYDGIIFVGGMGSSEYWDNPKAHKIAQDAVAKNKVLAAICIAPVTLAKAGVLKGKKATVFPSEVSQLKSNGVNYTGKDVETDGKIVTAAGPQVARQFGEKIRDLLLGR
ncbi:MAG: DJ-1/PfpI family protein [Endomicrobia bacterium]|nr:DJ-1/PfpI family protein [Endomicrobiia bacterium]MCX7941303.1 DJ-1/PfpI family protein [Endomicrobiia bacterium]MDW8055949.1 DJ-1/PfpI family protein [Elusimicrobiota bacterium]